MTRQKLLDYIAEKHKAALKKAGIEPTDTPENLYFVLYDAMIYEAAGDARQRAVADEKVAQLIVDKTAAAEEVRQLAKAAKAAPEIAEKPAVGE